MAKAKPAPEKRVSKKQAAREARARQDRIRRIRNWSVAGMAAAVVVGLIFYAGANAPTGTTDVEAWDLPALGPTADTQERVALADFRDRPTVVNFFASWCIECDRELPGFRTVSRELDGQVNFVGIASQETGNPLYMPQRHEVDWWVLAQDVGGRNRSGLSEALGARGMPLTAFYDENGVLLHTQLGALAESQLRNTIRELYKIEF